MKTYNQTNVTLGAALQLLTVLKMFKVCFSS